MGKKYHMAHIQSIWLTCCTVEPTCRKICSHAIPNGSHTVSNSSHAVPNGLYTVPCSKTLNGSQFMHDWFCQIRQINLIISRNSHYEDVNTSTHCCCTKICWHLNWSTIEYKFTMDRPIRSTANTFNHFNFWIRGWEKLNYEKGKLIHLHVTAEKSPIPSLPRCSCSLLAPVRVMSLVERGNLFLNIQPHHM